MKKEELEFIKLISNPTTFVWLFIYYAPNQKVSLVTRIQKAFFLFIKEFMIDFFSKKQISLFEGEEEDYFKPHNFGPFSKKIEDSIGQLKIQGKISINEETKTQEINIDFPNIFSDNDNYSDAIFTKNYKIFTLNGDENEHKLILEKIKKICNDDNICFNDFEDKFKIFVSKMCKTDINNILKYVYEKYPKYISKSVIKNDILGD